jgi:hypothetical protein
MIIARPRVSILIHRHHRAHFEINNAAGRAGLRIGSRLLSLSTRAKPEPVN